MNSVNDPTWALITSTGVEGPALDRDIARRLKERLVADHRASLGTTSRRRPTTPPIALTPAFSAETLCSGRTNICGREVRYRRNAR
ncbi:hypothetical protein ACFU5O_16020 [Streptomyces sp. NPDC057445]|uniref:hypothetical protein n=1 Tax=Streptomyces sp. NPDC057445 TaxID=3346136 RepID=UPI0036B475C1